MSIYTYKTSLTLLIAVLFAGSGFARQSAQKDTSLVLDELQVTASKIPQTERETTKPVVIIDRADIEESGANGVVQLLNQQSGIRVDDTYGSPANNPQVYLQGASDTYALVLLNGSPITDVSGTGGIFDLRMFGLQQIERIEIIKGSQSTLYGSDAIAGVINIITKDAGNKPVEGSGQLGYGSYNSFESGMSLRGAITPSIGYAFNGSYEFSDGISAAKAPEGESFEEDGFYAGSFNGQLEFEPVENLRVIPSLTYSEFEGDYDADAFMDADNTFGSTLLAPGAQVKFESEQFSLSGNYLHSATERSYEDASGKSTFKGYLNSADVYGTWLTGKSLKVLGGVDFQSRIVPAVEGGNDRMSSSTWSPYTSFIVNNQQGYNVEIGYRLTSHSEFGSHSSYSVSPSYELIDAIKVVASFSTAFKAPTLSQMFGQFGANPDLDPQKGRYINAGIESNIRDYNLQLSAMYFNREVDDVIAYTFSDGYANRDRQEDQGVEITAKWLPNQRVQLAAHYNYLDGNITDKSTEDGEQTDNLFRRPAHAFGFNATYHITPKIMLRGEGEVNGERPDLYFNPDNNFQEERVILDAYSLFNLYGEYRLLEEQLTVYARINNLLDADFTEAYGYATQGINIHAGLKFNF